MLKRIFSTLAIIIVIVTATAGVVLYSRGYRLNPQQKTLTATGILSASSYPEKASIIINGKLTSATNASLSLSPDWYDVKITKEGYQPWEKKVKVQGEVVTQLDALLIPTNPSLRALTVTGVNQPILSPSGTKLAYLVSDTPASGSSFLSNNGVWVFEFRSGPLGGKIAPKHIYAPKIKLDLAKNRIVWSPDEKNLLLTAFTVDSKKKETTTSAFLLTADSENTAPGDILTMLPATTKQWDLLRREKQDNELKSLQPAVNTFLTQNAGNISFSPDETKILYQATAAATLQAVINPPLIGSNSTEDNRKTEKGKYYIYDSKEDKNYLLADNKTITDPKMMAWYSDSKHILMVENNTIYISDYDGTNKRIVYGGPFSGQILFPWPSGGSLVILTNLNTPSDAPNLYEIDLK